MLTFTALVLIGITVTSAYKGIPDSEDKAFVFEKDEYSCVSQKTLPKNFTFVNALRSAPVLFVLSDDAHLTCPNDFIFGLTRDFNLYNMTLSLLPERIWCQQVEMCNVDFEPNNRGASWGPLRIDIKKIIEFHCQYFPNSEYSVYTNNSCNFWLCLGHLEQFKRQPSYPAFSFPVDKTNYYLANDPLPKELQATDTGLAIDVLKTSGQVFTIYKTSKRPIQTIEVITSKLCSGMVVSMDFDGMCTISVDFKTNQIEYFVNGKTFVSLHRPAEIVFTFTNSLAYLYTFQPMGFYPLTDCKFDPILVEKAEYNLKVWYDKTRASSSCEMVKLRISDAAAIKRWATTTTSAMTTTTTTPTEAQTTELSASTASTEMWAVVAVVCFAALVLVIVAVLLLIWCLKKH